MGYGQIGPIGQTVTSHVAMGLVHEHDHVLTPPLKTEALNVKEKEVVICFANLINAQFPVVLEWSGEIDLVQILSRKDLETTALEMLMKTGCACQERVEFSSQIKSFRTIAISNIVITYTYMSNCTKIRFLTRKLCNTCTFAYLLLLIYYCVLKQKNRSKRNLNIYKDGAWSPWQPWGDCSVTCGTGLRRRHRTCDNPRPTMLGRDCAGTYIDTDVCITSQCEFAHLIRNGIAFHAYGHLSRSSTELVFPHLILNEGNAYNNQTGKFVSPKAGLYLFTTQMCTTEGHEVFFRIMKLNTTLTASNHFDNVHWSCSSSSVVASLHTGDVVWVFLYGGVTQYLIDNEPSWRCHFSGALLNSS
ncbi:ATS8-like protein [Mya arenaria]|uniref:ATS8-like protein n=1 Tax=Mya arenaria TaxID=6604 RepID=A0ABY7EJW3_MYAAR|nr:ATS8-like protein [Mya arenaria]